jgi:hypothetical protein
MVKSKTIPRKTLIQTMHLLSEGRTMRIGCVMAVITSTLLGQTTWANETIRERPAPTAPTKQPVLPASPPSGPVPIPYPNIGSARLSPDLASISTMIADGKPTPVILDAWKGYVTRQVQSKNPINAQETIQQVQSQAEAQVKARTEVQKARIRDKLNSVGDDAQLANVDLQNILQKQQQTLQMMSNISKMMHDTAMAVIRKTGG